MPAYVEMLTEIIFKTHHLRPIGSLQVLLARPVYESRAKSEIASSRAPFCIHAVLAAYTLFVAARPGVFPVGLSRLDGLLHGEAVQDAGGNGIRHFRTLRGRDSYPMEQQSGLFLYCFQMFTRYISLLFSQTRPNSELQFCQCLCHLSCQSYNNILSFAKF